GHEAAPPPGVGDAAGEEAGEPADTALPAVLTIRAPDVTTYAQAHTEVGAIVLTGTAGAGVGWSWVVESVPIGSAVATSSLSDPRRQNPFFVPDVPGDYKLRVTGTVGGVTDTRRLDVTAIDAPIFYVAQTDKSMWIQVVGASGAGGG